MSIIRRIRVDTIKSVTELLQDSGKQGIFLHVFLETGTIVPWSDEYSQLFGKLYET